MLRVKGQRKYFPFTNFVSECHSRYVYVNIQVRFQLSNHRSQYRYKIETIILVLASECYDNIEHQFI